jgi:phage terminase small subunit
MTTLKNAKHELFAQALAAGASAVDAYKAAGYKVDRGAASRLSANVSIRARVAELQKEAADKLVMSLEEALQYAANVVRAAVGTVDEKSALAQEVTRDILTGGPDGDGEGVTIREKIKLPCKLKALDLIAKLKGWYAPEKKEVALTVNEERLAKLMGVDGA